MARLLRRLLEGPYRGRSLRPPVAAKFSRGLIERIIDFGLSEGWWAPGDTLADPFGGVGLGGIVAARKGLRWVGVELESNFQRMGNSYDCPGLSKEEWVRWYGRFSRNKDLCPLCQSKLGIAEPTKKLVMGNTNGDGMYHRDGRIPSKVPHHYVGNFERLGLKDVVLLQGDSRQFCAVVGAAGIISSPPFADKLAKVSRNGIGSKEYGQGGVHIVEKRRAWAELNHEAFAEYLQDRRETLALSKAEVDRQLGTNTVYSFYEGRRGSEDQWRIPLPSTYRRLKEVLNLDDRFDAVLLGTEMIEVERRAMKMGHTNADYGHSEGQIGRMPPGELGAVISSPPYADSAKGEGEHGIDWSKAGPATGNRRRGEGCRHQETLKAQAGGYGSHPANIGNLPVGNPRDTLDNKRHAGILGSCQHTHPRHSEARTGQRPEQRPLIETNPCALTAEAQRDCTSITNGRPEKPEAYGTTAFPTLSPSAKGVIQGAMPTPGQPAGIGVSSAEGISGPEVASSFSVAPASVCGPTTARLSKNTKKKRLGPGCVGAVATSSPVANDDGGSVAPSATAKSATSGNASDNEPLDYWHAVRDVYVQCYRALKPGGMLVLVCKNYVKAGKIVPLCRQTRRLLHSLGFQLTHRIKASLVKETVKRHLLGKTTKRTKRVSFFRRLAEAKGSPPIDYEEVIVAQKPETTSEG